MSVDVVIEATVPAVWAVISDIALPTRFSTELEGVEWLEGESGPRLGAKFVGRNQHAAIGSWQTECVVTSFEPEQCFGWSVGDPTNPSSIWRFTLTPLPDQPGFVRLEQWFQMGPARSGLNMAIDAMPDKEERIIARRLAEHQANMEATVAGIKALVEAHPA